MITAGGIPPTGFPGMKRNPVGRDFNTPDVMGGIGGGRMNPAGSRFGNSIGPSAGIMGNFGGAMGSIFGRRPSINEGGGIRFRPKRPFIKRGYGGMTPDMGLPIGVSEYDMTGNPWDDIKNKIGGMEKLQGSIGPSGGFGGMTGRLGKRQRRMAAEAARAQAAAPAVEG